MRYALAHATLDEIYPNDLPAWLGAPDMPLGMPSGTPASAEHSAVHDAGAGTPPDLVAVLDRHAWCITDAAADLGVSRQTLYRWIKNQSLVRPD